jgi:hypothetical protein
VGRFWILLLVLVGLAVADVPPDPSPEGLGRADRGRTPKKPDYARLRRWLPEIGWHVMGRQDAFTALLDRAEWLERQRQEARRGR